MTQTTLDHSGRPLPQHRQPDDGWQYHPEPRITQRGDQIYSDYGGRWFNVWHFGFHMPDNLRYRRPKGQQ